MTLCRGYHLNKKNWKIPCQIKVHHNSNFCLKHYLQLKTQQWLDQSPEESPELYLVMQAYLLGKKEARN